MDMTGHSIKNFTTSEIFMYHIIIPEKNLLSEVELKLLCVDIN